MAKKATRPSDRTDSSQSVFNWDTFISNVINGKYVLVLGSEIMLSKSQNEECDGDSTKLIFNSVKEQLIVSQQLGSNNGLQTFTELSRVTPNIAAKIRREISDGLECTVDEMAAELIDLIKTKFFRVVLTTTFDPYIEILMRQVWGDELRVMNISAKPSSDEFDYADYCRDDIPELIPPTLYYVFGKAFPATSTTRFVATENDAIEIMYKWMGKDAPQRFLNLVRSKRLLALGCKLDDWFFRFFWYMLRGDVQELSRGEVAITLNQASDSDKKLEFFLNYCEIHFLPDARAFISSVMERLSGYSIQEPNKLVHYRRPGAVFLSYAHEDFELVKTIFWHLSEKGIPVWIDKKDLSCGDNFNSKIQEAIAGCKVFIPILTAQVEQDIQEQKNRYYMDEWAYVQTMLNSGASINVVPLRTWGYNWRSQDNIRSLQPCMREKTIFDLERQSLDEFAIRLKVLLNI